VRAVNQRIIYTVEPKRRVITLTTFRKQRSNERKEVQRARNVLRRRQGKARTDEQLHRPPRADSGRT
jgi:hypothetical protein